MKRFLRYIEKRIKGIISYLIRPEIDLNHRLMNIIISAVILLLPANIVISVGVRTSWVGIVSIFAVMAILAFFLWLINVKPNEQMPILLLCVLINCVVLPYLYFQSGGRTCGMICWLIFAAVLSYLLMRGRYFAIYFVLNVIAFVVTMMVEVSHPEYVKGLESDMAAATDTVASFVMVSAAICAVFKYQAYLYKKQNEELSLQEKRLVEINEKLEAASLAKTNFLANMSHEIRTPINAILGMDEMILKDSNDEDILGYAADIDTAGRQLLSLVNDILDISKIEAGKLEICNVNYELFSILNDCYNLIVSRAKQKNLTLVFKNKPEIPSQLYGDEVRIRQIILNLLTNAVKYTEKGTVTLTFDSEKISDEEILLKLAVKDTGVGITTEDQLKLFNNFTRVDEIRHRNVEGTGLGLAITRQLVELMDGKIEVISSFGEGSEFRVVIPQKVVSWNPMGEYTLGQEHKALPHYGRESFTAESANVLAVDDVRVNLNVVRLLLRDTKVQIDLAESGKDALEFMKKKDYDLVLMDHMMPEMDGIEVLHHIREDEGILTPGVPVIALTANAITGVEKMYLDEGFNGYLSKPVRAAELEKILLEFLPEGVVSKNK